MWLVPREDLSQAQAQAVGYDLSRHRILQGGPGSGKTLVLAHRAKAVIEERGVPRDRVRMLVYTRVLGSYLRTGLADLGIGEVCLGFDEWCRALLREHRVDVPRRRGMVDHAAVRRLARDILAGLPSPPLDVLLVDEAQDLDETGLQVVALAARHVTIAMDPRQQLYDHGTDAAAVRAALRIRQQPTTVLGAYRCTPYIVALAAACLDDPDERARFVADNRLPPGPKEQPLLLTAPDDEAELAALAEALQQAARGGRSSLVLLPSNDLVELTVAGLRGRGLQVDDRRELHFDGTTPAVLTYHSAKGLTADAVFLPHLTQEAFEGKEEYAARMLFVGITRATSWLWLSTRSSGTLTELARLDPLVGDALVRAAAAPAPVEADDDDLLDSEDDLLELIGL